MMTPLASFSLAYSESHWLPAVFLLEALREQAFVAPIDGPQGWCDVQNLVHTISCRLP